MGTPGSLNQDAYGGGRFLSHATRIERGSLQAQEIEGLLQTICSQSEDMTLLSSAVSQLLRVDHDFGSLLDPLLTHQLAEVRQIGATLLGHLGTPEATDRLCDLLSDPDSNVVYHAMEALGSTVPLRALPVLLEKAQSGDFFMSFPAIEALGNSAQPILVPDLIRILGDPTLKRPVVVALGRLGNKLAVPALAREMEGDNAPHRQIVDAVCAIDSHYRETFDDSMSVPGLFCDRLSASAAEVFLQPEKLVGESGEGATWDQVCRCLGWLAGQNHPRAELAVSTLVGLLVSSGAGDWAASELATLVISVEQLESVLGHWDPRVRRRAGMALSGNRSSRAVSVLGRLADDGEVMVAMEAIRTLIQLEDAAASTLVARRILAVSTGYRRRLLGFVHRLPELPDSEIDRLLGDPSPSLQTLAIQSLGLISTTRAEQIFELLQRTTDSGLFSAALEALASSSYSSDVLVKFLEKCWHSATSARQASIARILQYLPSATELHRKALSSEALWTRLYACRAVVSQEAFRGNLIPEGLLKDPMPPVRSVLAELAPSFGEGGLELLDRLSEDSEFDVVRAAILALASLPPDTAVSRLRRLFASSDESVRLAVVEALHMVDDPWAVEALDLAVEDSFLKTEALASLWRSSRPDTAPVLCKYLLREDSHRETLRLRPPGIQPFPQHFTQALIAELPNASSSVKLRWCRIVAELQLVTSSKLLSGLLADPDSRVRRAAYLNLVDLETLNLQGSFASLPDTDDPGVHDLLASVEKAM